jgi:hypothetical protein
MKGCNIFEVELYETILADARVIFFQIRLFVLLLFIIEQGKRPSSLTDKGMGMRFFFIFFGSASFPLLGLDISSFILETDY